MDGGNFIFILSLKKAESNVKSQIQHLESRS